MATQSKSGNRTSRSSSGRSSGSTRQRGGSGRAAGASREAGAAAAGENGGEQSEAPSAEEASSGQNGNLRGPLVMGALTVVGTAALGAAGTILARQRRRRPRVLGIAIPVELTPRHFAPQKLVDPKKLASNVDLKQVMRQIGDAAERIEAGSEDVRMLSAQAKRLSRKLS